MRVFLAVDVDEHVRSGIHALVERLRASLDEPAGRHGRIGWVSADKVHVTLHFIGELAEPRVEELAAQISRPLEVDSFDVAFGGLGLFPPRGRPRVLWLGVKEGGEWLQRVHEEMGTRLLALGLPVEDRPFAPHLTLARFREPAPVAVRAAIERLDAGRVGNACRVTSVTLYRSRLSPRGATYTPIAKGALR